MWMDHGGDAFSLAGWLERKENVNECMEVVREHDGDVYYG